MDWRDIDKGTRRQGDKGDGGGGYTAATREKEKLGFEVKRKLK